MMRIFAAIAALATTGLLLGGCSPAAPPRAVGTEAPPATDPFTVRAIEMTSAVCLMPQRVGSWLYMGVRPPGEDKDDTLIRYNLTTGEQEAVVKLKLPDYLGSVDANERWLLWESGAKLYARSLATGDEQVVDSERTIYAPALNGDLVAFIDLTGEDKHEVIVRNLASGETTSVARITFPGLYNHFVAWGGDWLVWTDIVDDVGHYRRYNAVTGKTEDYALPDTDFRYPGYSVPTGDLIYSLNFDRTVEWDWTIQRVGFYSLAEKRFTPIEPKGFIANYMATFGDYVAIVDDENHFTVRRAGAAQGSETFTPVKGPVHDITVSADGSLIASYELPDQKGVRLYVIEPRD